MAAAAAHYGAAMALADELGMRPLVAHCRLGLGRLHRRAEAPAAASEHLAAAASRYRAMGMTFWLGQAEAPPPSARAG